MNAIHSFTYCNMLLGAAPTLCSFALSKGSVPPRSDNLNCDIISLRSEKFFSRQRDKRHRYNARILNTRTTPSMVTLTTLSPSLLVEPAMIWTPILIVVCCPKRTIFVPARQSQQTSALSAPLQKYQQQNISIARSYLTCGD